MSTMEAQNREWWEDQSVFRTTGCLYGHIDMLVGYPSEHFVELIVKGWIFHPTAKILNIKIEELASFAPLLIRGLERKDVHAAFPTARHSLQCGFAVAVRVPREFLGTLELTFHATLEGNVPVSGSFASQECSAWPTSPWTESEPENRILPTLSPEYTGKRVFFSLLSTPPREIATDDVFIHLSKGPPRKEASLSPFKRVEADEDDLKKLIAVSYPVARELIFVGDDICARVLSMSQWLGSPNAARIRFFHDTPSEPSIS